MPRALLAVHPFSYGFIGAVADDILARLRAHVAHDTELRLVSDVAALDDEGAAVLFVIGDPFGPFRRRAGCRYVFINFSLLYCLGAPSSYSAQGRRWVEQKQARFAAKVGAYDLVLDYFPGQAALITRDHGVPAITFPVTISPDRYARPQRPIFDIGFVGSQTPRRAGLARRFARLGCSLAPMTGVVLEDIAAQSRIIVNAQAFRSANLESPRIVSALLSGAALVSETSPALAEAFPPDIHASAAYRHLPELVGDLLGDPAKAEGLAAAARAWMMSHYLPRAEERWRALAAELRGHFGWAKS